MVTSNNKLSLASFFGAVGGYVFVFNATSSFCEVCRVPDVYRLISFINFTLVAYIHNSNGQAVASLYFSDLLPYVVKLPACQAFLFLVIQGKAEPRSTF